MVVEKGLILKAIDVDINDMHMEIALTEQVISMIHTLAIANLPR